jgi:MFS family permease
MGMMENSRILGGRYALTTLGSWSLVFLVAFEAMAVTTVMPIVTEDLDGRALYSLAFAATFAASVVGMVAGGAWADRRGPARPILVAIAVFTLGLVIAGTATSMAVFIAARFLQGLGGGGMTVALYVLVAKVYPAVLHPKIFGAFASAWILPSLIGPFVAGVVADVLSWHWVFLGVVALVVVATALMVPVVRGVPVVRVDEPVSGRSHDVLRIGAAIVVAVSVVGLSTSAEVGGVTAWVLAPVTVVVIGVSLRALLPSGTYLARAGLPAAVLLCGAAGATFLGTEVYLPLLLHDRYGLPAWLSGITLTAGAIAWALASAVQGRLGDRLTHRTAVRAGGVLLAAGAMSELVTAAFGLSPVLAAVGWFVAGAGMGTLYPRISTLVLAYSVPGEEGFNSAAKSIADAVGGSMALAVAGLIFGALTGAGERTPFVGTLGFTSLLAVWAVLVAVRVGAADPVAAPAS